MSVVDITPEPNEPFAFLPALTWYQTFYLTPPFIPVMAVLALTLCSRQTLSSGEIVFIFAVGAPIGFVLWVATWKTGGLGTGRISPLIGTLGIVGWIAWTSASFASKVHGRRKIGRRFLLGISALFGVVILSRGRGVAPLHLVLLCGGLLEITVIARTSLTKVRYHVMSRIARIRTPVAKPSEVPIPEKDPGTLEVVRGGNFLFNRP